MADFGGLFDVTVHGAAVGAAGDVSAALRGLAKTIPASGGTMYFPPGDYALGADVEIPRAITMWFANGARLIVRAGTMSTLLVRGEIQAGLHQIFGDGLTVRFVPPAVTGPSTRAALLSDVLPEWWGARGDGTADDTLALQSCIDACCGSPFEPFTTLPARGAVLPTTKGPPRWATARIRLGAGAVYRITQPLRVVSTEGFAITGAGMENSLIRAHGRPAARATAGTALTITRAGAAWRTDELRDMWVCLTAGTGVGQSAKVGSNTADTITFAKAQHVAPDATTTFVVLPEAVLDLDGCFEGSFDRFGVEGASDAGAYTGIYYHRNPELTARGSSSTNFAFIKVGGLTWEAAWQIGGLDDRYDNFQEDITEFLNCRARGAGGPSYSGPWYRNGWVFGTGTFANNLNHNVHGIDAVRYGYNVSVRATNVAIYGGTLQTAGYADIQVVNGLQGYFTVSGIRSEGSRAFLEYAYSPYSVFWSIRVADIEIDSPALVPNASQVEAGGDVITTAAHYTDLSGIRVLNPPMVLKQSTTAATRTSVARAGAGWTPHRFAGWTWVATGGTGKGQTADVSDNTADMLTFRDPVATAPDASTEWDVFVRPLIRVTKDGALLRVSGVALAGGSIDKSLVVAQHASSVHATVEGFCELAYAGATVTTMWPGPMVLAPPGAQAGASVSLGEFGTRPSPTLARMADGSAQLPGPVSIAAGSAAKLGFYGAAPVARPRVSGGSTADALRSLMDALVALGLISDGPR
ncbi:MAG TPA: hypothetical protein VGR59_02200 [Gemmatimonadaceae bacterium]|nr:hypothetical protein [Gemmatimonadaceae bacterium]